MKHTRVNSNTMAIINVSRYTVKITESIVISQYSIVAKLQNNEFLPIYTVRQRHRKMVKSDLISGGHIRPGPNMAGYENLAGFRPGPDMISGATLLVSAHHCVTHTLSICIYDYTSSSVPKAGSTLSLPIPLRLYTLPHLSNPPFLIFDIRALWRSVLSECQKLKIVG